MKLLYIILLIPVPLLLDAQVFPSESEITDYRRIDYLKDPSSKALQKFIFYAEDSLTCPFIKMDSGNYLSLVAPQLSFYFNSKYNYGYNDGHIWTGRGLTTTAFAGVQARYGKLHLSLAPYALFSENRDFPLANYQKSDKSEYSYQFNIIGDIDYVQRYGDKALFLFYPGQSELRFKSKAVNIGFSTSNYTIGPAVAFPVLMSKQGVGMPRFEIGTNNFRPIKIREKDFGKMDAVLTYGMLQESDYFDTKADNNLRYLTSLSIHYMIPSLETLILGVNRIFYTQMKNFQTKDLFRTIAYYTNTDIVPDSSNGFTNDLNDQMISFDLDWHIPEADFRVYLELVRNDFFHNRRDLFVDPEHSRAFNLGLEKMYTNKWGNLLINYEFTNLTRSQSFHYRLAPSMYLHYVANQGYSHQGQLLGAGIGPGSNSHHLSFSQLSDRFLIKLILQRVQFDNDYLLETYSDWPNALINANALRIFSEYSLQFRSGYYYQNWIFTGGIGFSKQYNAYYQMFNDRTNIHLAGTVAYQIN